MSSVRIYVATSADGCIAERDGSVDWLEGFDPDDYGYQKFWSQVGAVVMGRHTFEHVQTFAEAWPYAGRHCFVLASHPVRKLPDKTVVVPNGGVAAAVAAARQVTRGDVWVVGGATTMRWALQNELVDLVEVFYIPVFIGEGIPLLGPLPGRIPLAFKGIETYPDGVVKVAYEPERGVR